MESNPRDEEPTAVGAAVGAVLVMTMLGWMAMAIAILNIKS
jgi:hypothetical protein